MKEVLYDWGGANLWLFRKLNGLSAGWLDGPMELGSTLSRHTNFPVIVMAAALAGVLLVARAFVSDPVRGREQALRWLGVLAVFAVAYLLDGWIVNALKKGLDYPRPPAVLPPEALHVVGEALYRGSFPSGHTVFGTTVAAAFWPVAGRGARWVLAGFALWVGLSRIALGVHFPADVLAGAAIAVAVVWLARRALSAALARCARR